MKDPLKISLVQLDIVWENKKLNYELIDNYLQEIQDTDIIVLPEMFATGFSMNPVKLAETEDGETLNFLRQKAKEKDAAITGSVIINDKGKYFNRLFWVTPDDDVSYYDKRHLFRMSEENEHYTAGNHKLSISYKGWRILPLICYDLRFPVWSRNRNDFDLIIYVANWPAVRRHVWKTLLQARALENQVYVVGVNRVGKDGNGKSFSGDSMAISPKGYDRAGMIPYVPGIQQVELSLSQLNRLREKFPVALDADEFSIKNVAYKNNSDS